MVVLPLPLGALKMMSLVWWKSWLERVVIAGAGYGVKKKRRGLMPDGFLECVEHLFLDLFQLILHLNNNILHFGLIALGTGGVDFPAHFLSNEA